MISQGNINLLKSKSYLPEFLLPLQSQFRKVSILVLFGTVIAGIITVFLFITVETRFQILQYSKSRSLKQLETQKTKESLYLTLRSRIDIVDKVLTTARSKSRLLNNVYSIAMPPDLTSFLEDEQGKVTIIFQANSIEQVVTMNNVIMRQAKANIIRSTQLMSFSVDKGGIRISYRYVPVWE